MKKIFLSICFGLLWEIAQVQAAVQEFDSVEQAKIEAEARNRSILAQPKAEEKLPTNDNEMVDFLKERLEVVDKMDLQEGDTIDKVSAFSRIDDDVQEQPKKSMWEKIYDNAMARISGDDEIQKQRMQQVQYYAPKVDKVENKKENQIPVIDIELPNGQKIQAPAYEHIPLLSTQIELLPNGMVKIHDSIMVVANGRKVREGLARFIRKESRENHGKIQIMLDEVLINGMPMSYEIVEENDHYTIRPTQPLNLMEGVYTFDFLYLVDNYLWDYGDFYEFYWDVSGGYYNLLITNALAAVKLPGREPAVKRFALTGKDGNFSDENVVVMNGKNNTMGFANLYPLLSGDSMNLFITVPKVDFLPVSSSQKILKFLEEKGDIIISGIYLLVVLLSSWLSWRYIQRNQKFKSVNIGSAILVRALWRGAADKKAIGCQLLDMFAKNIIDIQKIDDEIILVCKSRHMRNLLKFEAKILSTLFSKKDNVCKLRKGKIADKIMNLIKKETVLAIRRLGVKLSRAYIISTLCMFLLAQSALIIWNQQAMLLGIFGMVDTLLLVTFAVYLFARKFTPIRIISYVLIALVVLTAFMLLDIYLHWSAALMLAMGAFCSIVFVGKASSHEGLLKCARQSVGGIKNFLAEQRENIGNGRNFIVQQANIFALDMEEKYPNNDKIRNVYRLEDVKILVDRL